MRRRPFLRKLGTLTVGAVASTVLNPFEVGRAVSAVYSNRLVDSPNGPPGTPPASGDRQHRNGRYRLQYEWTDTKRRRWQTAFAVDHAAYTAAEERSWGYLQAFRVARSDSHARRLGQQLETATPRRPSTTDLTAVDRLKRAVGFVTALEYAVDPDSKGVPEYHRTPVETLVDGRGDCKDLTYLLAGILSQPPFAYRTAMVLLPEHMLLGVHGGDLPAAHGEAPRLPDGEHVAVECTTNHSIGEFRDAPVLAIYDGGLQYVDHDAVAETTGRFLRDPTSFDVVDNLR